MYHALKYLAVIVSGVFLTGCGEGRWIEWETENNTLIGETFSFTVPVCYLLITPEKAEDGYYDYDLAIGRAIDTQENFKNSSFYRLNNYRCVPIDSEDFFSVKASYYAYKKWWLIGAHEYRVVILEDQKNVRSYMLDSFFTNTNKKVLAPDYIKALSNQGRVK